MIKRICIHLLLKIFSILPLQRKIVFVSYFGVSHGGSPGALFNYIKKHDPSIKCVWLLKNQNVHIDGAEVVNVLSPLSIYHYATAKVWIDNARKPAWLIKRPGQIYIQTWHGSLALKKIEQDAQDKLSDYYIECAKNDSKMADVFLSASKWSSDNYRSAFWYDGLVWEYGLPRSDVFFGDRNYYHNKVCQFYGLPSDIKLVLYAPTFRVDGDFTCYLHDYKSVLKSFENKYGGSWGMIIRLHPNVQNRSSEIEYDDCIFNGTEYKDINELLMASSFLITDYSSCMFDALLSKTKVLLYASDIEKYNQDRGCYFEMSELPFRLAQSQDQLVDNIEAMNDDLYEKEVSAFKVKCGFFDNGKATKKVAAKIINILNGEDYEIN